MIVPECAERYFLDTDTFECSERKLTLAKKDVNAFTSKTNEFQEILRNSELVKFDVIDCLNGANKKMIDEFDADLYINVLCYD